MAVIDAKQKPHNGRTVVGHWPAGVHALTPYERALWKWIDILEQRNIQLWQLLVPALALDVVLLIALVAALAWR
jgi:hypothetical protein